MPTVSSGPAVTETNSSLHHLAFDNSLQANIITEVSSGKIITANRAACRLLGYSKKELLTKNRSAIYNTHERSFKEMLKLRTAEGQSIALITAVKKSGKSFSCEVTSSVFMDKDGIEKAITVFVNMTQRILKQKKIDAEKEKIVADNINLVAEKQKIIDARKEKIVANDIATAKLKQKKIDIKNQKLVAHNVISALSKSDAMEAENNEWKKYVGKNSYDVMWDWNVNTGDIYVGDSIEEVFGYKVQGNTISFSDFASCLLAEEKIAVEERLKQALEPGNKKWNDTYMLRRSDGSIASTNSRASIIRDKEGKAIFLIGTTKDVSRLKELRAKLEEQNSVRKESNEIFELAAKISFDGIWDWNILTNDFFLGDGFEELFGHAFDHTSNKVFDWSAHLHPDDKDAVEKGLQDAIQSRAVRWEQAYRFTRADGSVAEVFGRASIIRDADGKACRMIGVVHDLSRQRELEEKLEAEIATKRELFAEYKENFKLIFNSSSEVLFDSDLVTGKIIFSDAYEKEFGYKITGNMTPGEDWVDHIHPADKEALMKDYGRMLASEDTEWRYSYRFLKADNSVANVVSNRVILRNADGKVYRMIGSMQDISKQKVLEEKLAREIKIKENQIAEAAEEAKNAVRSDLGRELHDNVNQLLSVSRLYVGMARQGGPNSETFLSRSSEYTLDAINEIRKLTRELTADKFKDVGLCDAITKVTRDTMEVNPVKISCSMEHFPEDRLNDKFKHTLFRIVQEQLNNILKHADATLVAINLFYDTKSIILTIQDNGIGFDTGQKRQGIGIDNIKNRAMSYSGYAEVVSQPGQGCLLSVTIPFTKATGPHPDISIQ